MDSCGGELIMDRYVIPGSYTFRCQCEGISSTKTEMLQEGNINLLIRQAKHFQIGGSNNTGIHIPGMEEFHAIHLDQETQVGVGLPIGTEQCEMS